MSPLKTIGIQRQAISVGTLTQVSSYGQYMIRLTQQAWQTYHLDQFKESENFDLIETINRQNQQKSTYQTKKESWNQESQTGTNNQQK